MPWSYNEYLADILYLTNKEALAVYHTVIKHDGHLRTALRGDNWITQRTKRQ